MQQENLWQINIKLDVHFIEVFMEGLADYADSMSSLEDGSSENWTLAIFTQTEPDADNLQLDIVKISESVKIEPPKFTIEKLEIVDWVALGQANFEAVDAGEIFVHPSWRKDEVPNNKIAIEIDPASAFGTGGHETTKGCLLAMQKLKKQSFVNILDMGCGSGLLGIAAAKLWINSNVLLVDNDPVCIDATAQNMKINQAQENCVTQISDGYDSDIVADNAKYDLIICNIVANPLIQFSQKAYDSLNDNGYIILAGLKNEQAQSVINAHIEKGFKLKDQNKLGEWSILIMGK